MPFPDLQSFLRDCESKGDLARVPVGVDPVYEIAEVVTRAVRENGPALWFERVKGSRYPVVANVLGSMRRCEWALDAARFRVTSTRPFSFDARLVR